MKRILIMVAAALAFAGCEPVEDAVAGDSPGQKPTKIEIIESGSLKPRPRPRPLKPRSADVIEAVDGKWGEAVKIGERPAVGDAEKERVEH